MPLTNIAKSNPVSNVFLLRNETIVTVWQQLSFVLRDAGERVHDGAFPL